MAIASNAIRSFAPSFGRLMQSIARWARIRKAESDLLERESRAFVGKHFDTYGRKEIRRQVKLRGGRVEDRFVRRSARNEVNLLLTQG